MTVCLSDIIARAWVYAEASVPYRHNGRGLTGMDCSGLLVTLARDFGLPHHDHPVPYSPLAISGSLVQAMDCQMEQADGVPRAGDWGLFWFDRHTREPQHIGMFVVMPSTGELGLLHAYTGVKKVTAHHLNKKWTRRLLRTYRFPTQLVERDC